MEVSNAGRALGREPRRDRSARHPCAALRTRALVPRIAHLGVGGFHRAHLARYVDELAESGGDWAIRGIGLLEPDADGRAC